MFTTQFENTSTDEIVSSIRRDGYFFMEDALSDPLMDELLRDVERNRFGLNKNWVNGVYYNRQYYLTHMLACSKAFTELVTAPRVFEVCNAFLGDTYRLKAQRYYETYGWHQMQWHTDNKIGRCKVNVPGLIFIAYLADVYDGEFQYIRGSQEWSGEDAYSDYSDQLIEKKYKNDVMSLKGRRGSLAIYNTYGIHRAKPSYKKSFVRKSIFFQVDSEVLSAEPLLLNPAFISSPNAKILTYLGFGAETESSVFPATGLRTLPLGRVPGRETAAWLLGRAGQAAFDASPLKVKNLLRKVVKRG